MRRRLSATVLVAGATAALAFGGGIGAWASWTTGSTSETGKANSARIPIMAPPRAEMADDSPKIAWDEVTVNGISVDRYVVIRSDGPNRRVACTVRTGVTACRDTTVTPGSTVRYYVYAALGAHWVGQNSEPSDVVAIPGSATTLVSDAQSATDSGKPDASPETPEKPAPGKEPEVGPSPPDETPKAATSAPASTPASEDAAEPSATETSGPHGQGAGSESPSAVSEGPGAGSDGQGGGASAAADATP